MKNYIFNMSLLFVVIILNQIIWPDHGEMPNHTFGAFVVIISLITGIENKLEEK